ncbi:hypothetical protein Anas_13802 [Armadillidium nasatum]|uniref:WAP domain-containing protein n=1 Tax=Armadillidium nasatum TaxID=96803 RepID=A0A5N5T9J3_9CRUS|nr:hypothetical protein Anas_13802 [Armadillidium nasatum]
MCNKEEQAVEGTGNCPNTSGIITTCEIKPGHCYCDRECRCGYLCCSYGCGPTCLEAVFE